MTLSEVAIRRPVFITMMAIGLAVLGIIAYRRLGTDLYPDVKFPIVTVVVPYPGASPEDVERQIVKPVEDAIVGVNGLDRMNGIARDNVGIVAVMFKLDTDFDSANNEVRQKIDAISGQLPAGAEKPVISKADIGAAPILVYAASGPQSSDQVRRITEDQIKPALEKLEGVAKVEVLGGREREVHVDLDPARLESFSLSPLAIVQKLEAENATIPAGHYDAGQGGSKEVGVRTVGEFANADEVRNAVLFAGPDGRIVRVGDVATVSDSFKEERTLIRNNAQDAVTFQIVKTSDANTVKVADAVKAELARIAPTMPAGYKTAELIDQSSFIKENAHEVELAIVFGGAMAILVILVFMMDLRSTFISALALPTSVLGTFLMMYALGFTLNMLTLLGLSLAIGLLIDDAVVVRENIFRHLEQGEEPAEAAAKGTREITLAVMATTFTIVAVFVPVAFMKGIVGQFFRQFGLTVTAAVMLSMLVAFTLDPMLSARLAKRVVKGAQPGTKGIRAGLVRFMERGFRAQDRFYARALRWTLAHPTSVIAIALGLFAMSLGMAKSIGSDFMATEDRGQFLLELQYPAEVSLAETSRRSLEVERKLTQDGRFKTVYATIGQDGEANKAKYRIDAGPKVSRKEGLEQLKRIARSIAESSQGVSVIAEDPPIIEGLGTWRPIMISIGGPSYDVLEPTARRVAEALKGTSGVTDVKIDYQPGKGETRVVPDRGLAGAAGIPVALIGMNVRIAMEGEVAGQVRAKDTRGEDTETDIRVRLAPEYRGNARSIARIPLATAPLGATRPGTVRLEDVAKFAPGVGPARIDRENRTRRVVVSAAVSGRAMGDVVKELRPKVAELVPAGYQAEWLGEVQNMEESNESFGLAFALAVLFIYVVLASQFESFLHPATIMLSLPLALIGALVGLWANRYSLSMGSQIGIMLLMGLVTKNAILLVDSALTFQRGGMSAREALMHAGPRRLRPILMTSAAMILGMLPTALSRGSGSEFRAPMAIAVIGGVISSTMLTLLVVPVMYLGVNWLRGLVFRRSPQKATLSADVGAPAEDGV